MRAQPRALDLVGPGEIAERLGVQRGTIAQWQGRGLLPAPLAVLSAAGRHSHLPVWDWSQIKSWAKKTGRL